MREGKGRVELASPWLSATSLQLAREAAAGRMEEARGVCGRSDAMHPEVFRKTGGA
jgi:hypothetical protein